MDFARKTIKISFTQLSSQLHFAACIKCIEFNQSKICAGYKKPWKRVWPLSVYFLRTRNQGKMYATVFCVFLFHSLTQMVAIMILKKEHWLRSWQSAAHENQKHSLRGVSIAVSFRIFTNLDLSTSTFIQNFYAVPKILIFQSAQFLV